MGGDKICENGGTDELVVAEAVDWNLWREERGNGLLCAMQLRQCEQRRSREGMLLARIIMIMGMKTELWRKEAVQSRVDYE